LYDVLAIKEMKPGRSKGVVPCVNMLVTQKVTPCSLIRKQVVAHVSTGNFLGGPCKLQSEAYLAVVFLFLPTPIKYRNASNLQTLVSMFAQSGIGPSISWITIAPSCTVVATIT